MKNKIALLLSTAMIASTLSACSTSATETTSAAAETEITSTQDPIEEATETETEASDESTDIGMSEDETKIRELLTSYRNALADSDPAEVIENYTVDGVVMGPGSPTAIGDELSATYEGIFSSVGLNLDFTLANIIIGDKYAFVQSTSDGTATVAANGEEVPEQNRELFVMEKVDGDWKIAFYMYNKMS